MLRVYCYEKCSTCRKALKWLVEHDLGFELKAIRETPPTQDELAKMLAVYGGEIRRLFNTSSQDYRDAGLKDRLTSMSSNAAFDLLRGNGNLVKRPFVVGSDGTALVGFDPDRWAQVLLGH